MCSPFIVQLVQERIKREGRPIAKSGVSRRDFLRIGGLAAAGVAVSAGVTLPVRGQNSMRIVDLTQPLTDTTPTFPAFNPPVREVVYTVENDGFYVQTWSFAEHSATHMDAPGHFVADAPLVDELDPANFIAPLVVIDIAARAEQDPDALLTPDDIMAWESANGEIPAGALVAMYSGWETKYTDVQAFRGMDDSGVLHFPGLHPEAILMLTEERDIVGMGVDTLSLDHGPSSTFDAHFALLRAGKYGLENLKLAEIVSVANAMVFVGIPLYQQGSGGPCRVLAMVNE